MSTDPELKILELPDSVAWAAGTAYERRRIGECLRQRADLLVQLPGPTSRSVVAELRRLADQIDVTP
jgi:hypothetical protein